MRDCSWACARSSRPDRVHIPKRLLRRLCLGQLRLLRRTERDILAGPYIVQAVLAAMLFTWTIILPETPRRLTKNGLQTKGLATLADLHGYQGACQTLRYGLVMPRWRQCSSRSAHSAMRTGAKCPSSTLARRSLGQLAGYSHNSMPSMPSLYFLLMDLGRA